jgi:hypothetical protein
MVATDIDRLVLRRLSEWQFVGTVAAISGAHIRVTRPGQGAGDNTYYSAAAGLAATVATGDRVLVLRTGASWAVICKLV